MRVVETIPEALAPEVEAARAWLSAKRGQHFEVSGIIDPDAAARAAGQPHELGLILCDGDLCVREQVRIQPAGAGFEIEGTDETNEDPPAEMDPLPGVRQGWLDGALARHAFVVLVFYRGFW